MPTEPERRQLEELYGSWSDDEDDLPIGPGPTPVTPPRGEPPRASDPHRRPPRVGTAIQRSDADNRRKALLLLSPPPPPDRRRRQKRRPPPKPRIARPVPTKCAATAYNTARPPAPKHVDQRRQPEPTARLTAAPAALRCPAVDQRPRSINATRALPPTTSPPTAGPLHAVGPRPPEPITAKGLRYPWLLYRKKILVCL
ncbi:serine/arginine repetitive matrix protein 1-like [Formica exsecta]|uniref:serine/arginine repetitive matrix protein 1-like n=1 Tax=Formica exsecta TaxID=72781 RepID=UPI0011435B9D|nr:serine/arginine repetitive matrix protein 1-like [Formica exsecta]